MFRGRPAHRWTTKDSGGREGAGRGCTGGASPRPAGRSSSSPALPRTQAPVSTSPGGPACVQRLGRPVLHLVAVSRPQIPWGSRVQPRRHGRLQRSACLDFPATELLPLGRSWTLVGGQVPAYTPPAPPPGASGARGRQGWAVAFCCCWATMPDPQVGQGGERCLIPPHHPGTLRWRPGDLGRLGSWEAAVGDPREVGPGGRVLPGGVSAWPIGSSVFTDLRGPRS